MVSGTAAAALTVVVLALMWSSGGALTAYGKYPPCPEDKFDCKNGKCISGTRWCDGIDNCGNNKDELSCRICLSGSLKCKESNQCVPPGARCNGETECLDASDEAGCDAIMTEPTFVSTNKPIVEEAQTSGASNHLLSATITFITVLLYIR